MDFMARALTLAASVVGKSSPNPPVGAVIVRRGTIVGEGATQPAGHDHAEIVALKQAGVAARGASVYVTLEPCAHQGRTPPCTDALIAAGVASVEAATLDPSPWVNGAGVSALRAAGIGVRVGDRACEARHLIEGYVSWALRGRPFVTAVYAWRSVGSGEADNVPAMGPEARDALDLLLAGQDRVMPDVPSLLRDDPTLGSLARADVTTVAVHCDAAGLAQLRAVGLLDRTVELQIGGPGVPVPGAGPDAGVEVRRLGADVMIVRYTEACSPASLKS
ncbi:MAG: bifunctional diaminohydroxyphosphoribosylaminopyrimidine deaminase/5-amino-6-(5-phosphoribosylamino)uracil reductase RibD [Chloroflexota bacterium]